MASFHESPLIVNPLLARALACLTLLACLVAGGLSARAGLGRLLTEYGRTTAHTEPTWAAQTVNPSDPEAPAVRAFLADEADQPDAAITAWAQAAAQRPRDYWLWLELGRLQSDAGDAVAGLAATRRAVQLAPYYTQPRWQLANMLWRLGQTEAAWDEMRRAVASDPALLPASLAMAWHTYRGDVAAVTQALPLTDTPARQAWAQFLAEHDQPLAADKILAGLGAAGRPQRQALLKMLWQQEQYAAAYPIWHGLNGLGGNSADAPALDNGDFERPDELADAPGFTWRTPAETSGYLYAWDTEQAAQGRQSLRFTFKGSSDPATPLLTQTLPVAPQTRYTLSLAVRTEKLLTGGLPIIIVRGAGRGPQPVLAQSLPLPAQTDGWQTVTLNLTTPPAMAAVVIAVQRQNCPKPPCPCFGQLALDDFRWRQL